MTGVLLCESSRFVRVRDSGPIYNMQIFSEKLASGGRLYCRHAMFCSVVNVSCADGGGGGTCRGLLQQSERSEPQHPRFFESVEVWLQHVDPLGLDPARELQVAAL